MLLRTLWVKRNVGKGTPTKIPFFFENRFGKPRRFSYAVKSEFKRSIKGVFIIPKIKKARKKQWQKKKTKQKQRRRKLPNLPKLKNRKRKRKNRQRVKTLRKRKLTANRRTETAKKRKPFRTFRNCQKSINSKRKISL